MPDRIYDDDPELHAEAEDLKERHRAQNGGGSDDPLADLGEWDAGEDNEPIPPRGWLLGNIFCRRFVSSLLADGGVGKTAVRIAQCLALATGRSLTGEHVFQQCRVLIVSLEDDRDELRRRVRAAMLHHGVKVEDVKGWLFLAAPGFSGAKLATSVNGALTASDLKIQVVEAIERHAIDAVCLDPFVKSHSVEENANNAIDFVIGILSGIAIEHNCAVDAPHHVSKGPAADAGNANRGRGASAFKDGARLVYTLTPMSSEEAKLFGVTEDERRPLIRMDSGKVNIAPPARSAKWFKLIGVALGNATDLYPRGDEVQTVETWEPPDIWEGMTDDLANLILTEIDEGLPGGKLYSNHNQAKARAAWPIVQRHRPELNETQARDIIKTWLMNGLIYEDDYHDADTRKNAKGLRVSQEQKPESSAP